MTRKATIDDIDFLYSLYMAPAINPFLLYEMMGKEAFTPILEELLNRGCLFIFMQGDEKAGMFKLVPQQYRNNHIVYLGGLAIAPSFTGKGLARIMLDEVLNIARGQGFHRMELTVATINSKAIRLYESAGFKKEGVLKDFAFLASENRFLDEQIMAYLF